MEQLLLLTLSDFFIINYEKKLLSLKPEDTVEVKIERQGPEGYTEITCTVEVSVLP